MIKHKLFLLSLFLFYGAIAYPYTELRVTRMRYRKSHIARLHILLRLVGKRLFYAELSRPDSQFLRRRKEKKQSYLDARSILRRPYVDVPTDSRRKMV